MSNFEVTNLHTCIFFVFWPLANTM